MDNMVKVGFMLAAGASFGAAGALFYFLLKKDDYIMFEQNRTVMQTDKHIVKEIMVPVDVVGALIGRKGANIKLIQQETLTKINFKDNDAENEKFRTALIRGSEKDVKSATRRIQNFIDEQPKIITEEIHVPQYACGMIIGRGGENIRNMSHKSQAKISIESSYSEEEHLSLITIRGSQEQIDYAKQLIHEMVVEADKRGKRNPPTTAKITDETKQFNLSNIHHQLALTSPPDEFEDPSIEDMRYERLIPSGSDGFIETYSSAVTNPSKFFLQNVGPRSIELDKMMENMTDYYCCESNRQKHIILAEPINVKVGDIVAAPFTNDQCWYRGEVRSITPNDYDPGLCNLEIFYIDFGDLREYDVKDICTLDERFMNLPFQAIECCLQGIQPKNSSKWSDEATKAFESLIYQGEWKVIMARVVSNIKRDERKVAIVQLIDTIGSEDVDLSGELVKKQFAETLTTHFS